MSNPIEARRLVVTIPSVTGDEADIVREALEDVCHSASHSGLVSKGPGIPWSSVTVAHALGESLPEGVQVRSDGRLVRLWHVFPDRALPGTMTAYEARQIAGALLAHADTMAGA